MCAIETRGGPLEVGHWGGGANLLTFLNMPDTSTTLTSMIR